MDTDDKKPKRLRGVAGKRTDKRPRKRTAQLVHTTGPSGTLRDGRIVYQSNEPLISLYTMEFSVPVEDVLLAIKRLSVHLEESMSREDDQYIDTNLEVGVETKILAGNNPHVFGSIQIVPRWRRVRRPEDEQK